MVQVGLRLRAVREVMSLNQAEFGRLLGVTGNAIGNYERGDRVPDPLAVMRLEMRFGFPMNWIFAGQLRNFGDFDRAAEIEAKAAELGAVIGAPVAEWPMALPTENGQPIRIPGHKPRRKGGAQGLHEDVTKFP